MHRLSSSISTRGLSGRRPAETDTTVLALGGIVIVLLLIVATVSGLAVWQWKRAHEERLRAEAAYMEALAQRERAEAEAALAHREMQRNLEQIRLHPQFAHPAFRSSVMAGGLVAAPVVSPWPLLPLLSDPSEP